MYYLKSCLIRMKKNWKVITAIVIMCILVIIEGLKIYDRYRIKDYITHEASFIWFERWRDGERVGTYLYQYGLNGQEMLLEDRYEFRDFICSKDNKRLLSFIGGWENFTIAEYDIENRELHTILKLEEIDTYLDENRYEKSVTGRAGSCVRYYDDETKISFIYDRYLMGYSKGKGLEVIYSVGNSSILYGYSWLEQGESLLICDDCNLIKYDRITGEKEMVAEKIRAFDVSPNAQFIIVADNDGITWKYELETGKTKKIFSARGRYPILRISGDNRYLIYENKKSDSLGMGSYSHYIYVINIKSEEKILVRKLEYGFSTINGVAWRNLSHRTE